MITLKSDRLRVELPDCCETPNDTLRFDRAGYISDVILDGNMHFLANEPKNLRHPTSGGRGLCNEYTLLNLEEPEIGEYYPKLGVGLIRKENDKPYTFWWKYKDVKIFPVTATQEGNTATYVTEPIPCLGFAAKTTKTISLEDTTITMTVKLENVGEKIIDATEYCHNFFSIDGMAFGPDYKLEMPCLADQGTERMINAEGTPGICSLIGNGKGFILGEFNPKDSQILIDTGISEEVPFEWRVVNTAAKAYVEVKDYFVPHSINIWGLDHLICPEVFNHFTVAPGETYEWTRTYTFGLLEDLG